MAAAAAHATRHDDSVVTTGSLTKRARAAAADTPQVTQTSFAYNYKRSISTEKQSTTCVRVFHDDNNS